MVVDWMMLSRIVKYRVYCVILRRPSSPSFCNFSRYGNTTVINCKMMDAVIYGMMPRAKIVKRRRLPPLNKSKIPRTDPWPCWKRLSSTRALMPGVGICAPMRYTASNARVNNTLFRKSGMRKRFRNASMNRFILLPSAQGILQLALAFASYLTPQKRQQDCRTPKKSSYDLKRAACLRDFFLGGRAECVRVNRDFRRELAIAENLYAIAAAANESMGAQPLRGCGFARGKT